MKDCNQIRERLSAFIDNELSPPESSLIEKHLHGCPECAKEASSLRQVIDLLDGIPDESPSPSFSWATLHRAYSWKRCAYVKEHILMPALAVLHTAYSLTFYLREAAIDMRRTSFNGYLRSFDDFPPESLSSVYISLIQGDSA